MLLFIMFAAIILLLVLIMKFKVHAFVALIIVSLLTALAAPVDKILPTLLNGFGSTLASVALLVGLGAMIGRLLEITGGAKVLADTLINKFGKERAFALGVASLLFGFPIFFDAGLVVMLPIILAWQNSSAVRCCAMRFRLPVRLR